MHTELHDFILTSTGATAVGDANVIQSLWSGYGQIVRYALEGSRYPSVVVKQVRWPRQARQGESDRSHQRKVRSYQVEVNWYLEWASRCDEQCRVPGCLGHRVRGDEVWLVLEDLDASGFSVRRSSASDAEVRCCLAWLAHFHATFLGIKPQGLWKVGTYWHLDTRPDELKAMDDEALRKAAPLLDRRLRNSPFQTLVHGDAKLANFCFARKGGPVAAVDFQYVGGGCGMKDVAYLLDSCYTEDAAERMEKAMLDYYFSELRSAVARKHRHVDMMALEQDWRALYALAWTDFHRFLKGWSPGRWNRNGYSERTARSVIEKL